MDRRDSVLIEDVRIIDGTGADPRPGLSMLVDGGRIGYVGPSSGLTSAWDGARIAGAGRTVVPGLIDLHTHTTLEADMRCYLRNGVTTVRYAGIDSRSLERLRTRIASAHLPSPRLWTCGPMLDAAPASWPEWSRVVTDPGDARSTARELLEREQPEGLFVAHGITPDLLRPVIDEAHANGRPVVGQLADRDIREYAELGIDQVENTSRILASPAYAAEPPRDPADIPHRLALLARAWTDIDWDRTEPIMQAMVRAGVAYCPTFVVWQHVAGIGRDALAGDPDYVELFAPSDHAVFGDLEVRMAGTWSTEDAAHWRLALDTRYEWLRRFRAIGGVVLLGTDMQYGGIQAHAELANLVACGLSPLEAITAATGGAARAARQDRCIGTLEVGKTADFLVLRADPLEHVANLRAIDMVVQNGVPMTRNDI
jgi:hypothetical protein